MHPLRFPNSGIRAKVFMRKIGFKLREGWPHACCLHAEVSGHSQAHCRGSRPWLGYLQGAAARRGNSPQGAATRKGQLVAANRTANRGGDVGGRGGRPLAGRLSTAKGSRRLRRGSDGGGIVRVKVG
ncbi:hypothetical protein BHE74_00009446 [Ensete ventricosum]|nr:hypothetical protein BHE74_00009446 [Ensete ventricosum]